MSSYRSILGNKIFFYYFWVFWADGPLKEGEEARRTWKGAWAQRMNVARREELFRRTSQNWREKVLRPVITRHSQTREGSTVKRPVEELWGAGAQRVTSMLQERKGGGCLHRTVIISALGEPSGRASQLERGRRGLTMALGPQHLVLAITRLSRCKFQTMKLE